MGVNHKPKESPYRDIRHVQNVSEETFGKRLDVEGSIQTEGTNPLHLNLQSIVNQDTNES